MSTQKHPPTEAEQRELQQREEASKQAQEQTDNRDQPHTLSQRANMQRQGKQMHQQDGKQSR